MSTKPLGPRPVSTRPAQRKRVEAKQSQSVSDAKLEKADADHLGEADSFDGERGQRPPRDASSEALLAHLRGQPWFDVGDEGKRTVSKIDVVAEQQVAVSGGEKSVKYALTTMNVRFDDGTKERWLVPLRTDAKGNISDALASPAFKQALVDAVANGVSLEPIESSKTRAPGRARRRPAEPNAAPKGWLGATLSKTKGDKANVLQGGAYDAHVEAASLARAVYGDAGASAKNPWRALIDKGYTTRERYEHVVAQTKKLSPKNADALIVEFFKNVYATREAQPESVRQFHEALATKPKFGPVFYGYAQFMGVPEGKKEGTFDDVAAVLDVVQGPLASMGRKDGTPGGLGFRELELLPFYASPQKDGGYDISKHDEVAASLGGNAAFGRFMGALVERGMRLTADLVGNHVSNEHAWVKSLLKDGDTSMLSRFVIWDDAIKVGERVVDDKTFNIFLHTKGPDAGKVSHVWQIFPDNNPDTMIAAKDPSTGKVHNAFASFMNPFQWDVNAEDPQVLSHFLGVIGHFANLGQMGTRMDAIIHMGKKAGTFNMNNPESQAFMALTKAFASHVAPGNLFLPEANLDWDTARRDWLEPQATFDGRVENTAGDALISFDVHRAIWDSLLKGDKAAWVKAQHSLGELPPTKSLLVYLGLHDETLIEDPALRKQLIAKGASDFAGRGVGDSPAALLDHDADRLAMAHVLLYSSKGHPAVYYRTLVGATNNEKYFDAKVNERLEAQRGAGDVESMAKARDTRDLDRGPIGKADYERALREGYKPAMTIKALNALWEKNGAVRTNKIDEVANADPAIVSYARTSTETSDAPLLQLVNLSGAKKSVTLDANDLARQLGWKSVDELTDLLASEIAGATKSVRAHVDGAKVTIEIAPYGALLLQKS